LQTEAHLLENQFFNRYNLFWRISQLNNPDQLFEMEYRLLRGDRQPLPFKRVMQIQVLF